VPPDEYNPDEARALLEEAGYGPSNPLQIELRATNQSMFLDQAALVQQMWAEVGVEAEILPLDKAAFWDPILISGTERDPEAYGEFEAGLEDFGGGSPMIASYYETQFMPYMGENATCYNEEGCYGNPEAVAVMEDTFQTVDPEELKPLFEELSWILKDDVPYIRILWLPNVNAVRSQVKGYETLSQNSFPLKYVWLEE
jgi:ABC-type transport system substrate-binding protein